MKCAKALHKVSQERTEFMKYLPDADVLLAELSYELIPAAYHAEKLIRDAKRPANPESLIVA